MLRKVKLQLQYTYLKVALAWSSFTVILLQWDNAIYIYLYQEVYSCVFC